MSPALWVVAVVLLGIIKALGKDRLNPWLLATVSIWLVVPVIAKTCVFKVTSPVPLSPLKSKSLAASKEST